MSEFGHYNLTAKYTMWKLILMAMLWNKTVITLLG